MSRILSAKKRMSRFTAAALSVVFGLTGSLVFQTPAQALTATVNAVSFKAPVFDSYNHATGGGAWNDGSVTYDKGELLGTNYRCGDVATFLLELNTSATPTKQPAPYKAQISVNYTWDSTGAPGASLTALSSTDHLKTNTGVITKPSGATLGTSTNSGATAGVTAGWDGGFNAAGISARVATSPAPVVTNTGTAFVSGATPAAGDEFGGNTSTSNVTFVVENVNAGANIVVRSDAVIHCKPGASPTGNMQASLQSVKIIYPGAPEDISAGNQTVNFRGVGNLAGLGSSLSVTKSISANGTDCTSTISTATYASAPQAVRYCYTVTNTGNVDVTNVVLKDDNAIPGNTSPITVNLSVGGATAASPVTIPVGGSATGFFSNTYSASGAYTNIATVTSSAPTVTASALITITGTTQELSVSKAQTSGNPSAAGDVITYSLTIVNKTGNNSPAVVTDANASSVTCATTTVNAPAGSYGVTVTGVSIGNSSGATIVCTATHIVSDADVTAGKVINYFVANKSRDYTSNSVVTPITVRPLTYDISVYKVQTSTAKPSTAGQTITYSIQVTNVGTGTLTSVGLTDNLSDTVLSGCVVAGTTTTVTLPIASFLPGASFTCVATHTIQPSEVTAGSVTNYATATTTSTLNTPSNARSNDVVTTIATTASLRVDKIQATGSNANTGQYPSAVGQVLTYGIGVTNDGNVTLTAVVVTDPNADTGTLVCASPFAAATAGGVTLTPGQSIDCTASHTVTAADLTTGSITNVAYATGSNGGSTVNGQSSNVVTTAALRIVKSLADGYTPSAGATAGENIRYKIVVTNTGSVTLTGIVVTDANAINVSCPATQLTAGQSMTCTANHIATLAEATAGHAYNTASVTTTQISGAINSNRVDTPLAAATVPHVSIVKARTSAAPVNQGDTITYSLTITSDGVGDVLVTSVTDANAVISGCVLGGTTTPLTLTTSGNVRTFSGSGITLASGSSIVCTASHQVVRADFASATYSNTASITATGSSGSLNLDTNSNTVTDPLTLTRSLSVVKSYTSAAPSAAGDVIVYSIVVTNTGTVTLNSVSAVDLKIGVLSCTPAQPVATLAPGASFTCTGSYTVLATDVTAGGVVNTATASGTDPGNSSTVSGTSNTITLPLTAPTPTPPAPSGPNPSMTVVKALTGAAPTKVGDTVGYTITVTNNGDIALAGVNVTDANATLGTCSVSLPATLAVNASFTCAASHVVTDADFLAGHVDNTAIASSTTGALTRNSNVVTVPLSPVAGISIVKTLNGAAPSKLGDVITYKIVVTNTGNVSLTSTKVTDANATLGACSPAAPASLAPGALMTCSATHVVTISDMIAGKVDNIANVTANSVAGSTSGTSSGGSSSGSTGSAIAATSAVVTVPLNFGPKVAITKKQVGSLPTAIGGFIYYTINVTNIGNVTLHDVTIKDENATISSCTLANPVGTLAVGDSYSCSAKHELTDADVLAGKVINIAAATTKENATASSDSSANPGGGSTGGGSNASPGSVNVPSNQVLTIIRIASIRHSGVVVKPNGGTVTLGAAVLKNPKLNTLAFTGDLDNVQSDASLFIAVLAALIGVLGFRRRALKK